MELEQEWNFILTVCRKNVRGLSWEEFDALRSAMTAVQEKLFPAADIPIRDAAGDDVDAPASNGEKADVPV
jgi:hypothetical protein